MDYYKGSAKDHPTPWQQACALHKAIKQNKFKGRIHPSFYDRAKSKQSSV